MNKHDIKDYYLALLDLVLSTKHFYKLHFQLKSNIILDNNNNDYTGNKKPMSTFDI